MLADQVNPDGSPWDGCARTFLKQAVAELAAEGYELQASFEPEFSLGRHEGASFTPIDESLCYSATGFHLAHDYTIDLVDALIKQGLEVEHYYPELGHGQQEVPIRHASALRAADNHVLLRETARAVAIRHGLWASFAPKPLPEQAGNGAHLHASLWADGANAFADPSGQYGLSALGYHFLAGVLAHLPGLVALTCGTVNSYRRLAPQMWSGAFACYGPDNREAALRICSPIGSAGSVNLELKPVDSTGNPYLALGAFIYAGIDGIRRSLDRRASRCLSTRLSSTQRNGSGCLWSRLPSSLGAALDALEADSYPDVRARAAAVDGLPGGEALGGGALRSARGRRIRVPPALAEVLAVSAVLARIARCVPSRLGHGSVVRPASRDRRARPARVGHRRRP